MFQLLLRHGGGELRFELGKSITSVPGTLNVHFPRSVYDALLAEGLPQENPWVPSSGGITFQVRGGGVAQMGIT